MNHTAKNPALPWVTVSLLLFLTILSPYAMGFTPFSEIYPSGVYGATHSSDPLYTQRVTLILLGLGATFISAIDCCVTLIRKPSLPTFLTCFVGFFACAVVGWRSFPYWTTGVYAAMSGRVPSTDFDPKGLIPMTWIGDLWRLPILLLYLAAPVAIIAGIVAAVVLFRRHQFARAVVPAVCTAISVIFLVAFSPSYLVWLMD